YLSVSTIKEDIGVSTAKECLKGTLEGFKVLLKQQREILSLAGDADDEGTASQMSDYIKDKKIIGCLLLLAKVVTHIQSLTKNAMNVMFIAFFIVPFHEYSLRSKIKGQINLPLFMINATTPQSPNTAV
ncbi:hypothetical protein AAUPMB_08629, partial [Pasteurella multocida subsp. multocida str. Anand1_buffalo]